VTARGRFITFEGIDGSGKSTQARRLYEALRAAGHEAVLTREPGGSPGAEEIRRLVLEGDPDRWSAETEILLFTAARRDHLERTIEPALAAGKIVVCDRFADSTRMYQGLSRGDLRALVDQLHTLMIGREPDLTVLIDMDPQRALARSWERMAKSKAAQSAKAREMSKTGNVFAPGVAHELETEALELKGKADSLHGDDGNEDRFESFGLPMQKKMRAGFLALAEEFAPRFRVIDGARSEEEVARDVLATVERALA